MTAPTHPLPPQTSSRLLKISLIANAIFSALHGIGFILMAWQVTAYLGWFSPWLITLIGIGLLGFSGLVAQTLRILSPQLTKAIIFIDLLWVVVSGALLLTPWIAPAAKLAVAVIALAVAVLAILQSAGLNQAGASSGFSVWAEIHAPVSKVWEVLADIGTISQWNPGVKASHLTSNLQGIGASRHCNLGRGNFLDEQVINWQPEKAITFRITKTNLPMGADIHFRLEPTPRGTRVEVQPIYTLKHGILGLLLDTLVVKQTYTKGMQALVDGLKQHVEACT